MSEQDPRPTPHPTPDPTESTAGPSVEVVEPGRRWRATLGTWSVVGFLGRLHHTHSWLVEAETEDPVPPEVLAVLADAIATESGVPTSTKATPGSAHHDRMLAAGATAYQQCPPSVVDPTTEANRAWAEAGESLPGVELEDLNGRSDEEVLANWVRQYTWVHERWSAVRDEATAREVFAPMLADELDRARSVLVRRRGEPVAEAFTFVEPDGGVAVVVETLDREVADGVALVRAAVREVLRRVDVPILFDGHVDDPHYPVVLGEIPEVTGAGLDLLELGRPAMLNP